MSGTAFGGGSMYGLDSAPGGSVGLVLSAISRGPKFDQHTQKIVTSYPEGFRAACVTNARTPQGQALQAPAKTGFLISMPVGPTSTSFCRDWREGPEFCA